MRNILLLILTIPGVCNAYSYEDLKCLAENAFYEARNQGAVGMTAVIDVTLNRVKSKRFPNTICGVVYQKKQFSWTHEKPQKYSKKEWEIYYKMAEIIAQDRLLREKLGVRKGTTGGALWYHADYIKPYWVKSKRKTTVINRHIFYVSN